MPTVTPIVRALLIANLVVFVLQMLPGIGVLLVSLGALVPAEVFHHGQIWRLATYMFLHSTATVFHLLLNMLVLWMFGSELEELFGSRKFLTFYLVCGIGAGLFSVFHLLSPLTSYVSIIGASGAILGVLTAFAVYFPNREVLLFFILPVRVWILVVGYALLSLLSALSQRGGMTAHLVHFGGIAVAFGYLRGKPMLDHWLDARRAERRERTARSRARTELARKRHFEANIDPILRKISEQGMESLTGEEKKLLKEAGRRDRQRLRDGKIVPLDPFRKKRRG